MQFFKSAKLCHRALIISENFVLGNMDILYFTGWKMKCGTTFY